MGKRSRVIFSLIFVIAFIYTFIAIATAKNVSYIYPVIILVSIVFVLSLFGLRRKQNRHNNKNVLAKYRINEEYLSFLESKRNDSEIFEALYLLYGDYNKELLVVMEKNNCHKELTVIKNSIEPFVELRIIGGTNNESYLVINSDKALKSSNTNEIISLSGYFSNEIINLVVEDIKNFKQE